MAAICGEWLRGQEEDLEPEDVIMSILDELGFAKAGIRKGSWAAKRMQRLGTKPWFRLAQSVSKLGAGPEQRLALECTLYRVRPMLKTWVAARRAHFSPPDHQLAPRAGTAVDADEKSVANLATGTVAAAATIERTATSEQKCQAHQHRQLDPPSSVPPTPGKSGVLLGMDQVAAYSVLAHASMSLGQSGWRVHLAMLAVILGSTAVRVVSAPQIGMRYGGLESLWASRQS